MPAKKTSKNNDIVNFYEHKEVQKLITKYHNPNFEYHQIKVPFRAGIIASSGGGKTQLLLNLISKLNDTLGHIHVVYKASEPLYEFLAKSIGDKNITFYTKLADLPLPNDFPHKDKQQMVVFDDCVNDKNQQSIMELFIRGRKIGKSISMVYLSQSFFKIPKIIRQQFNYLFLLKLSSARDLNLILSDFSLGVDKNKLVSIYKQATKERFNFLKIDLDCANENKKFSHNWTDFYKIEDIDSDSDSDSD